MNVLGPLYSEMRRSSKPNNGIHRLSGKDFWAGRELVGWIMRDFLVGLEWNSETWGNVILIESTFST